MPIEDHIHAIEHRELEIRRLFLQFPDLTDYFYKAVPLTDNALPRLQRSMTFTMCEALLSHFSSILTLSDRYGKEPPEFWDMHRARINHFFLRSPTLRQYYHDRMHLYHKGLEELL
jgi:hypothetical protein